MPCVALDGGTVITFRPLADDDLGLLHRWLNEPGVVRWWEGDDVSEDAVVRDYGSASSDPTEHWVAVAEGHDIGWIQCYATEDFAAEEEVQAWRALGVDDATGGIDYLIGEPSHRGRGIGATMIRAFLDQVVFPSHPTWPQVGASPVVANVASWRALEKAGFSVAGEFDSEHGRCRLLLASNNPR